MKKKLIAFLAFACAVCCAVGLDACSKGEVEVTDVTLNWNEIALTEGTEQLLTVTVTPTNATDKTVQWSSSDESIATVDDGTVFAVAGGTAIITASTKNGKTAQCTVTVQAKQEEEDPTQYEVTFNANGGKFANGKDKYEVLVDEGEKLSPVTVTREGKYVFAGWYKDEYRTEAWDIDTDTVTDDVDLYAGWTYLNDYQSVIDALAERIKTERNNNQTVEILSIFTDTDGKLCFVEKDGTGVFSYATNISGFDEVKDNAEIIAAIPTATLTLLKNYNAKYTSDNNAFIADCMAYKYTEAMDASDSIIYSCVTGWESDTVHITTNGSWFSCEVKAIIADENGRIFDCSFTVVTGVGGVAGVSQETYFNYVIGGSALSQEYDMVTTELGAPASDFYAEYLKSKEA